MSAAIASQEVLAKWREYRRKAEREEREFKKEIGLCIEKKCPWATDGEHVRCAVHLALAAEKQRERSKR